MKEGKSSATGHIWELRSKPGDKEVANIAWDDEKKEFIKGVRTYFYCIDCKQWAWGAKPLCPEHVKVVYVPELVVS